MEERRVGREVGRGGGEEEDMKIDFLKFKFMEFGRKEDLNKKIWVGEVILEFVFFIVKLKNKIR